MIRINVMTPQLQAVLTQRRWRERHVSPTKTYYVYKLTAPRSGKVRYVGCTISPTGRLCQHLLDRGHGRKVKAWIKKLKDKSHLPVMTILETVPTQAEADEREAHWIGHFRELGADLLNTCRGTRLLPPKPKLSLSPMDKHRNRSRAANRRWARERAKRAGLIRQA